MQDLKKVLSVNPVKILELIRKAASKGKTTEELYGDAIYDIIRDEAFKQKFRKSYKEFKKHLIGDSELDGLLTGDNYRLAVMELSKYGLLYAVIPAPRILDLTFHFSKKEDSVLSRQDLFIRNYLSMVRDHLYQVINHYESAFDKNSKLVDAMYRVIMIKLHPKLDSLHRFTGEFDQMNFRRAIYESADKLEVIIQLQDIFYRKYIREEFERLSKDGWDYTKLPITDDEIKQYCKDSDFEFIKELVEEDWVITGKEEKDYYIANLKKLFKDRSYNGHKFVYQDMFKEKCYNTKFLKFKCKTCLCDLQLDGDILSNIVEQDIEWKLDRGYREKTCKEMVKEMIQDILE